MRRYLLMGRHASYLNNVVWYMAQDCYAFDRALRRVSVKSISILEESLRELLDTLYYMQDVFDTGVPALSEELFCALRAHLLQGVILPSIRQSRRAHTSADSAVGSVGSYAGKRKVRTPAWWCTSRSLSNVCCVLVAACVLGRVCCRGFPTLWQPHPVDPMFAMFLLAQVFRVLTFPRLRNSFAAAILEPRYRSSRRGYPPHARGPTTPRGTRAATSFSGSDGGGARDGAGSLPPVQVSFGRVAPASDRGDSDAGSHGRASTAGSAGSHSPTDDRRSDASAAGSTNSTTAGAGAGAGAGAKPRARLMLDFGKVLPSTRRSPSVRNSQESLDGGLLGSPHPGIRREGSTFSSRASLDSDWQSIGSSSLAGGGRGRVLLAYKDMLLSMLYGEDQRRAMGAMVRSGVCSCVAAVDAHVWLCDGTQCVFYAMLDGGVDRAVLDAADISKRCDRKMRNIISSLVSPSKHQGAGDGDGDGATTPSKKLFAGAADPTPIEHPTPVRAAPCPGCARCVCCVIVGGAHVRPSCLDRLHLTTPRMHPTGRWVCCPSAMDPVVARRCWLGLRQRAPQQTAARTRYALRCLAALGFNPR